MADSVTPVQIQPEVNVEMLPTTVSENRDGSEKVNKAESKIIDQLTEGLKK